MNKGTCTIEEYKLAGTLDDLIKLGEEAYESLMQPHLEDLCTAAQASYVLPTPGWSIKVVAPYFGFDWTQDASEVDAMKSAMIWFKQALTGGDGTGLDKVLQYNEDDCRAMIVVKDGFNRLYFVGVSAGHWRDRAC